ncbi:MAG: ORF6C domain-containing protein [Chloroflexi bacterium]|uniref:ORF6C domain-containing protein n=1 Tax=Candidatus Chlorohelix allophototropha TaxID=3003348 RepID=A0A8T7M4G0_9CHLR|nr:ORF6C domain-containing protein [Chloroflexota bacterium]WJW70048.1 phage antirepressor N-terminal domain-containing protein [Chloroflexota bacterium L227-S17]
MSQNDIQQTPLKIRDRKEVQILEDNLPAYRLEDGAIFLPVNVLCEYLGLDRAAQIRRIKREESLAEELQEFPVETTQGLRDIQFLRLEVVPYWLAGITIGKVKPELQDKLKAYKKWVVQKVYEAFLRELAPEPSLSASFQNLVSLREIGLALVQLADEQLALEQQQSYLSDRQEMLSRDQLLTREEVEKLKERVDNAAGVVGKALTRIKHLEERTSVGALTEEQATEISLAVKEVAGELARRDQKEGNPYQRVFLALYQRYGIASYKQLPSSKFKDAIEWLNDWYKSLIPSTKD